MLSRDELGLVGTKFGCGMAAAGGGTTSGKRPGLLHLRGGGCVLGTPERVDLRAVKGESAGGGLAACLALLARDRKEVALSHQFLVYPMLDDRTAARAKDLRGLPAIDYARCLLRADVPTELHVYAGGPRLAPRAAACAGQPVTRRARRSGRGPLQTRQTL